MRPIGTILAEFKVGIPGQPFPIASLPLRDFGPSDAERHAAELDEARTIGRSAGLAEAAVAHAAELADLEADHVRRTAEDRAAWVEAEGAVLARLVTERLAVLEHSIAQAAADALEALLPQATRRKAVDELRTAVATLLGNDPGGPLTIVGPGDLVEAVAQACAGRSDVTCIVNDEPDVTIRLGETRIRSVLAQWGETLAADLDTTR